MSQIESKIYPKQSYINVQSIFVMLSTGSTQSDPVLSLPNCIYDQFFDFVHP